MAQILRYLNTYQTEPYGNLALEELLLRRVQPGEIILLLWQNQQTVVIGRNQNAWRECRVEQLEQDGGYLARRRSGGGAVYHDLGNLNFSFVAHDAEYDVARQLDFILLALQKLGLAAEKSGRNDIIIDGRKFSGNAFQSKEGRNCHHGTILIDVNREKLAQYLSISAEKMQSKGVSSVQSRVANLSEFMPGLSVARIRQVLVEAFGEIYDGVPDKMSEAELDSHQLASLRREFASWQWRLGRPIAFTQEFTRRFAWGDIQIQLQVNQGRVQEAAVFSDALATEFIAALPMVWRSLPYTVSGLLEALEELPQPDEQTKNIAVDIGRLITEELR